MQFTWTVFNTWTLYFSRLELIIPTLVAVQKIHMLVTLTLRTQLRAKLFIYSNLCQRSHWHPPSATVFLHQAQRGLKALREVQQNVYVKPKSNTCSLAGSLDASLSWKSSRPRNIHQYECVRGSDLTLSLSDFSLRCYLPFSVSSIPPCS